MKEGMQDVRCNDQSPMQPRQKHTPPKEVSEKNAWMTSSPSSLTWSMYVNAIMAVDVYNQQYQGI